MKKFLLVAFLLTISTALFAQDAGSVKFDPFVSIRMFAGYHGVTVGDATTGFADRGSDLVYRLQANSRFGTTFSAGDTVKGIVELGFNPNTSTNTGGPSVYMRLANATYNFGAFQLEVGQDYTPYTWVAPFADVTDDNNMGGFGASYDGRQPQIKLMASGFYVALIAPSRTVGAYVGTTTTLAYGLTPPADTKLYFPKTAIGYDLKLEGLGVVGFGGAMNMVKIRSTASAYDGKSIISWIGFVHCDVAVDMIGIRANFAAGQNAGNFGIVLNPYVSTGNYADTLGAKVSNASAYATDDGTGSIKNSTHIEGYINPYLKLAPNFQIGVAVGYQSDKSGVSGAKADVQMIYAVDARYAVDKYISFSPTFAYRDYMKDGADQTQGKEWYAGIKFQADIK